jgi:hypothetical protein
VQLQFLGSPLLFSFWLFVEVANLPLQQEIHTLNLLNWHWRGKDCYKNLSDRTNEKRIFPHQ